MITALLILQATVTCQTVGGVTRCTDTSQPPVDYGAALRGGASVVPPYQAPQARTLDNRERQAEISRQQLRERVGAMVAAHDCESARDTALRGGDFDLAAQVKVACE